MTRLAYPTRFGVSFVFACFSSFFFLHPNRLTAFIPNDTTFFLLWSHVTAAPIFG